MEAIVKAIVSDHWFYIVYRTSNAYLVRRVQKNDKCLLGEVGPAKSSYEES